MEASVMSCVRIGSWHHIIHAIYVIIYSIWQSITGTTVAPDADGGYHNYLERCLHSFILDCIVAYWRIWMNWKAELLWNTVQLNYSSPNLVAVVPLLIEFHKVVSNLNLNHWTSSAVTWFIILLDVVFFVFIIITVLLTTSDLVCRSAKWSGATC